jgi:hypothetical protein
VGASASFPTVGTFAFSPRWFGSGTLDTRLHLLEWTVSPTTHLPDAFTGYATSTSALANGSARTVDLAVGAVTGGTITASTDAAADASLTFSLWIGWPGRGALALTSGRPGAASVAIATPALEGTTFAVAAERRTGSAYEFAWRRGLDSTATPTMMALPTAAVFTAPAHGALADLSTDFTWTPLADAVYVTEFYSLTLGAPMLYVVTKATTARMPDFSWAGLTLPAATTYYASVAAAGPCASADEAAASTEFVAALPSQWHSRRPSPIPAFDGFASRDELTVTTP